jgi:hypothetical protein
MLDDEEPLSPILHGGHSIQVSQRRRDRGNPRRKSVGFELDHGERGAARGYDPATR